MLSQACMAWCSRVTFWYTAVCMRVCEWVYCMHCYTHKQMYMSDLLKLLKRGRLLHAGRWPVFSETTLALCHSVTCHNLPETLDRNPGVSCSDVWQDLSVLSKTLIKSSFISSRLSFLCFSKNIFLSCKCQIYWQIVVHDNPLTIFLLSPGSSVTIPQCQIPEIDHSSTFRNWI